MQSMLLMYAEVSKVPGTPEQGQATAPARQALGRELEAAAALKDEPCQQA